MAKATSAGGETLLLLSGREASALEEALIYLLTFDSTDADTYALARVREALGGVR